MGGRNRTPRIQPDRNAALFISEAFLECAETVLSAVEDRRKQGKKEFFDAADIAAAGTNLLLSIELAFKAVIGLKQQFPPGTHDLVELFETLKPNYRDALLTNYRDGIARLQSDYTTLVLSIALEEGATDPPVSPNPNYSDLPMVLERARHGFVQWRYLFEKGAEGSVVQLRLDFEQLRVLQRSLVGMFVERLSRESNAPLSFGRRSFRIVKDPMPTG